MPRKKENAISGIYMIKNQKNGNCYIGSAKSLRRRFSEHRRMLRKQNHHSSYLNNAWNKYGESSFVFSVICYCSPENLIFYEQRFIDGLNPEYNICRFAGNSLGRIVSPETRRKISEKSLGKKRPETSEEWRANISASLKGVKRTAEHMAALQAGRRAHVKTDEQKKAISESLKAAYRDGRRIGDKCKNHRAKIGKTLASLSDDKVVEIRLKSSQGATGRFLAAEYGVPASTISNIINRKTYLWVD